jgi:hypothetical protein
MTQVRNILELVSTCKCSYKIKLTQVGLYSITIYAYALQADP